MGKWIVAAVAVVALGAGAYYYSDGFASRVDVAKDKIVKKIDSLLGETEVMKKQIERDIEKGDRAIESLQKSRIEAQVKSERLGTQAKETTEKVAEAKGSLEKLETWISTNAPVEIAGKTYTQKQVADMAGKVLQEHKLLTAKLESQKKTQARMEQIAASQQKREDAARSQLNALKGQLEQVKLDLIELNGIKDAARIASDTDTTFGVKFDEMEKKINTLSDKVKTELRWEDEKWKSLDVNKDLDSADKIISATKEADVLTEIKKVLEAK